MIPGLLMALFISVQPITVSGPFLYCNEGKCPKMACLDGWEYRGWDMNGREYMTCRTYTVSGHAVIDAHNRLKGKVKDCF